MGSVHAYPLQYAFIGVGEEEARKIYRKVVTYTSIFKTSPNQWMSSDECPSVLKFVCHLEAPEVSVYFIISGLLSTYIL